MKYKYLFFSFLFLLYFFNVNAQEDESAFSVEGLYVGELSRNFSGGLQTGNSYMGLIDLGIGFSTKNAGLWKGWEAFIQFENTHGGTPSATFVNDLQVFSNIENGNYSYLYELWYKQQIGFVTLQFGLIDLNADYFVAEPGGLFVNSSFGIQPSASLNMPVPIFPMNSLSVNLKFVFTDWLSLQTGVWDGDPGDLNNNPYNYKWTTSKEEGYLFASEIHLKYLKRNDNYLGTLKLGGLYHTGTFNDFVDNSEVQGNMEFHLIAEQTIIDQHSNEDGKLDAFLQLGWLPDNQINLTDFYIGGGLIYSNLFFLKKEMQLVWLLET